MWVQMLVGRKMVVGVGVDLSYNCFRFLSEEGSKVISPE